MKVRIVNDGKHGYNIHIYTEDGRELEYVSTVDVHYEASNELPTAILTVILPIADIIADAEIKWICALCGRPVDEEGKSV